MAKGTVKNECKRCNNDLVTINQMYGCARCELVAIDHIIRLISSGSDIETKVMVIVANFARRVRSGIMETIPRGSDTFIDDDVDKLCELHLYVATPASTKFFKKQLSSILDKLEWEVSMLWLKAQ